MQPQQLPYDQLTPLEQCIADFMARQEKKSRSKKKMPVRELMDV